MCSGSPGDRGPTGAAGLPGPAGMSGPMGLKGDKGKYTLNECTLNLQINVYHHILDEYTVEDKRVIRMDF